MSLPVRHFLGWDGPLVRRAAGWLWREIGPHDLRRCLVVAPTAHSARRLREALAEAAGGALLSPLFRTPDFLFRPGPEAAPPAVLAAVWAETLRRADPEILSSLVPEDSLSRRDGPWALAMADLLMPAVERLADSGLRPQNVARATDSFASLGAGDGESERWQAIDRLEAQVSRALDKLGLVTPAEAKIRRAESPELPSGIERVIFASVPDPVPLACRAVERLMESGGVAVDVLVDAPTELEACFDHWGRPLAAYWKSEPIDLPGGDQSITVTVDDESAAREAVAAAAATGSNRLALCVPDATLLPALSRAFLEAGWPVFDPEGMVAGRSGLLVFLDALRSLLTADPPSFDAANALLRCPEAAAWPGVVRSHAVARALDRLHGEGLPESLDDALDLLESWATTPETARDGLRKREDASLLATLLETLDTLADTAQKDGLEAALREVFDGLATNGCDDGADGALLETVSDSLDALALAARAAPRLGASALAECWIRSLPDVRSGSRRTEATLDALGWLESPYEEAEHLVVAGMHHGSVPDGVREDAFLPDGLRAALGLRSQETRDCRDAFLFRAMVEARRKSGSVRIMVSKFDGAGEPRKPSGLLMLCREAELARRVLHVFQEHRSDDQKPRPPRSRGPWKLSLARDPVREARELSVVHPTLVKNYLRCPTRFYLTVVLGMERYDPETKELAATDFGSLVHIVLEEFGRDEGMRDCAQAATIARFLDQALDRQVMGQFGKSHGLPLMVQVASARERLRAFANWQAADRATGWRIHDIEFRVGKQDDRKWQVGGLPVSMKIDRIDRHESDGRWRVLDYKTSGKAKGPEEQHLEKLVEGAVVCGPLEPPKKENGTPFRWTNVQLPLYAAFWRQFLGAAGKDAMIETGYVNLPSSLAETGFEGWDGHDTETEVHALQCTEAVVERIRQGIFWPPSLMLDESDYDDYAALAHGDLAAAFDEATQIALGKGKEVAS